MNILGKLSLLLSLFCFLITFGFKLALSGWIPFIGWGLGFGAFFLLFGLFINPRFIMNLLKSESLQFLLKSTAMVIVSFLILFVLNFIVYKKNWVGDLTTNKIHSLSDMTQELVRSLPEPLTFYYFHVDNAKVRGYAPQVKAGLKPYLDLSSNVHLRIHSVFKHPDLAKKFKTGNEESTLFAEYNGRIERIASLTEPSITNSILKLSKDLKKIYFLQSNDERKLKDDSTFGLSGIKQQLERLHYKIEALGSLNNIPDDIAVLVIVGPRQNFSDSDLKSLHQFIKQGGSLFVAVDPGEDHNLTSFFKEYGVSIDPVFMFSEQAQAGQSDLLVLTHSGMSTHEVSKSIVPGENPGLFISSSLSIHSTETAQFELYPILEHLPNSVGRADLSTTSPIVSKGKQFAAIVAEAKDESHSRFAIIGDSDFMTNQFYMLPGNFNLVLGLFTYLSKDEDLLKIKVPKAQSTYLTMTQTQMNLYFLFFILPFSALFFVFALFFKLRRFF